MIDQSSASQPEPGPLPDPFTPEIVRVATEHGDAINVVETVRNYAEAQLPEISSTLLQAGDRLTIEFDDEAVRQLRVLSVAPESQAFGSDDLLSPLLTVQDEQAAPASESAKPYGVYGSAISPRGTMMTPGTVKTGHFLVTGSDEHVSRGEIKSFLLERPDEDGVLHEVRLNQTQETVQSQSFTGAEEAFVEIKNALGDAGFNFEQKGPDGFSEKFRVITGDELIFAGRQGFGSGVIPQDEAYVYNAPHSSLFALRYMPTEGKMQVAAMHAAPEEFAKASFRESDWREANGIGSSTLHRLSHKAPLLTYTWLQQEQENPTITLAVSEEYVGSAMADGTSANSCWADVNIELVDGEPRISVTRIPYWIKDEDRYKEQLTQATSFKRNGNVIQGQIGDLALEVPLSPTDYINYLVHQIQATVSGQ